MGLSFFEGCHNQGPKADLPWYVERSGGLTELNKIKKIPKIKGYGALITRLEGFVSQRKEGV